MFIKGTNYRDLVSPFVNWRLLTKWVCFFLPVQERAAPLSGDLPVPRWSVSADPRLAGQGGDTGHGGLEVHRAGALQHQPQGRRVDGSLAWASVPVGGAWGLVPVLTPSDRKSVSNNLWFTDVKMQRGKSLVFLYLLLLWFAHPMWSHGNLHPESRWF